jgi:tetratricopeptide (TPR) repeat protein
MRTLIALFLCAAVAGFGVAPASASPDDEAEALIRKGVEQRRRGNHIEALELFERASAITPSARALAQRGLAESSLRRWVEAERHLGEALARHDSPWIDAKENRSVLEQAFANVRTHVGSLRLQGTEGADVKVNDQSVGRLPVSKAVRVPEGTARVTAVAPGRRSVERDVAVRGGDDIVVRLDLEAQTVAAPTPVPTPAPVVEPIASEVHASPAPPPLEPPSGSSPQPPTLAAQPSSNDGGSLRRQLGWATAVAAFAALAGGIVETILWQAKRNDFNDPAMGCDEDAIPTRGGAGCSALYDSAERARLFAMIGYGAAAILGGTSALLFLSVPSAADTRTARMSCAPNLASPGVSCRLAF